MEFVSKFLKVLGIGTICIVSVLGNSLSVDANVRDDYPGYVWYIPEYEIDLYLGKDGILDVEERIVADFSSTSRRGIIREIPYRYVDLFEGVNRVTPIKVLGVEDFDGNDWEYKDFKEGGDVKIRIGNENVYWSEPLEYVISYEVENALNSFNENMEELGALQSENGSLRDELYWNAIGTEWSESPIGRYKVRFDLSNYEESEVLDFACFSGGLGSNEECDYVFENGIMTIEGQNLGYQEGVTLGVAFGGGVITPKMTWRSWLYKWQQLFFLMPIVIFLMCILYWRKHGKDLDKKIVIPTYKLNPELNAMEVGALVDEKVNNEDITAGIMDLAVRGYIQIKEVEKKGWFGKTSFEFVKLKDFKGDNSLEGFEKALLKGLFGSSKDKVSSKDLVGTFYITVGSVSRKLYDYLVDQGYYKENPNEVKTKFLGLGFTAAFLAIWGSGITQTWYLLPILLPLGLGLLMIAPFMSKKTKHGMEVHAHILGFKEFIDVAEKDRVKFFQEIKDQMTKDEQIVTFERLLPYAVAFGMGDRWADLFDGILVDYSPVWYAGGNDFNMRSFGNSLNDMSSGMKAASVSPSSSSSGGSFSSGGFSGGGFGGGGGSSW